MKNSKRRSMSMREELYFALKLYTEQLNLGLPEKEQISVTTVGTRILQAEIPPIPQGLLDEGKAMTARATNFGFSTNRYQASRAFAPTKDPPKVMKAPLSKGEPIGEFSEDTFNPADEFYSGTMKL